jgi:ABC-2 type transport system ATP-binding protein
MVYHWEDKIFLKIFYSLILQPELMKIRFEHITKVYGTQKALDQIDFTIDSGQIIGLLGPNGAGKSTLIKILIGLLNPENGRIAQEDTTINTQSQQYKNMIGYLPEDNPLPKELFAGEYLAKTAALYSLKNFDRDSLIKRTGLSTVAHKKIGTLSKGFKQRLGLAAALIHGPKLLVLDEPMTGLDPNQIQEIRKLIKSLSPATTVLLSTHILQDIVAICDRILVLNKGQLVQDVALTELENNKDATALEALFAKWTA